MGFVKRRERLAARDDQEQARLHKAAEAFFGVLAGTDPRRSERVSELVRERLLQKWAASALKNDCED